MTLELYPSMVHEGSVSRDVAGSDIDDICQTIHEACQGFGTNEKALFKALGSISQENRYKVPVRYEQMFEKKLYDVVKSECGSKPFGKTLQYLSVNPVEAECEMIHAACKGAGTDEFLLVTIIAGRSNKEIDILKKAYFDRFSKDLGSLIASEAGGHFEQLLMSALQGVEEEYDESVHDASRIKEDIKKLHDMGLGKIGCDEAAVFKFLVMSPAEYLKKVNIEYAEETGFTLSKALEHELKGDTEAAASFLIGIKTKPYEEVAKVINKACSGVGTNEALLQATLIRYQGILDEVKVAHVDMFGKTIGDRIESETRGGYESLLKMIAGEE